MERIRGTRDKGTYVVHCRLDRTLVNSDWSDMFPTARCHYLLFEGSEIIDLTKLKSQKMFRYDRRLHINPEVKALVDRVWNNDNGL